MGRYLQLRFCSAFCAPVDAEDAGMISMTFRDICGLSEEYRRSTWYWTAELESLGRWQEIQEISEPLVRQSIERPSLSWSHERCIVRVVNALMKQDLDETARQLLVDIQNSYTTIGKRLKSVDRHPLLHSRTHIAVCLDPCSAPWYAANSLSNLQNDRGKLWQIFVMPLTGGTVTIDTKPDATVSEVLYQAQYKAGLSVNENRLIFGGKQLEPGRLLAEYDVQKGSTLHAVLHLAGGDGSPRDCTILSASPDYIHNNDIYDGLRIENSLSRSSRSTGAEQQIKAERRRQEEERQRKGERQC